MNIIHITKSGFIEDESIFKHFKEEANNVVKNTLDCIDKDLQRTIILLNQFPGLATRFCCSGHLEDPDSDGFYIVAVVRDQITYDLLENVVYNYNRYIVEHERFCSSNQTIFSRHLSISKHGLLVTNIDDDVLFYPTVELRSFSGPIIDSVSLDVLEAEVSEKVQDLYNDVLNKE